MKLPSVVLCLWIVACVAADYDYYVPNAFYRINENGQKTYLIEVPAPDVHQRFRRSPQYGFGFQSFPQFGFPLHGGQFSGVSASSYVNSDTPALNSRFGEDEDGGQTHGQTTTFHSNNGQYKQTTHRFGPDGSVQTYVNTGKV